MEANPEPYTNPSGEHVSETTCDRKVFSPFLALSSRTRAIASALMLTFLGVAGAPQGALAAQPKGEAIENEDANGPKADPESSSAHWTKMIEKGRAFEVFKKCHLFIDQPWAEGVIRLSAEKAPESALEMIEGYKLKSWAKEIILGSAKKKPGYALYYSEKYKDLAYFAEIVELAAKTAAEKMPWLVPKYISLYQTEPWAKEVILQASEGAADDVIMNLPLFKDMPWAFQVMDKATGQLESDRKKWLYEDIGKLPLKPNRRQALITVFKKIPLEHAANIRAIIKNPNGGGSWGEDRINIPIGPNGLEWGGNEIKLPLDLDIQIVAAVLIHEIGHNVDFRFLKDDSRRKDSEFTDGPDHVFEGDLSLDFYRISWLSEKDQKKTASEKDFVSLYAMRNPRDDFAESYAYYILHNRTFSALGQKNEILQKKYEFMEKIVFNNKKFDTGKPNADSLKGKPHSVPKIPFDLKGFLSDQGNQ